MIKEFIKKITEKFKKSEKVSYEDTVLYIKDL